MIGEVGEGLAARNKPKTKRFKIARLRQKGKKRQLPNENPNGGAVKQADPHGKSAGNGLPGRVLL